MRFDLVHWRFAGRHYRMFYYWVDTPRAVPVTTKNDVPDIRLLPSHWLQAHLQLLFIDSLYIVETVVLGKPVFIQKILI